jgi:hypothetical protein
MANFVKQDLAGSNAGGNKNGQAARTADTKADGGTHVTPASLPSGRLRATSQL